MDTFLNWLIGEAGAGWVIGILGTVGGVYVWLNRERAPRVFLQEVDSVRLLDIHESQRNKLRISYGDEEENSRHIDSLEQREIVIYNNGTKDILEPLSITVKFVSRTNSRKVQQDELFWRLIFDEISCTASPIYEDGNVIGAQISIPYLNSFPVHSHYVRAYLISEHYIELELIKGIGKGWSANLNTASTLRNLQKLVASYLYWIINVSGLVFALLMLLQIFTSPILKVYLNPSPDNIETALETHRQDFELLRTYGFFSLRYLQFGFDRVGGQTFWLFYTLFLVTMFSHRQRRSIAEWGTFKYLGIQPASKFSRPGYKQNKKSRLEWIVQRFLLDTDKGEPT